MALAPVRNRKRCAPGARAALTLASLLGPLGLSACGPSARQVEPPHGIVSLNPCTDAILAEVADPAQVRALSAYSRDPDASSMDVAVAARFPSTTGTVEEIAALRPALVVSGNFTPPATRDALARLGIKLVEFPIATTVPESLAQIDQIAAMVGHRERGAHLTRRINAALTAAAPTGVPPFQSLIWQGGGIVAGDGTLIADLLKRTGFANAAAARGLQQADYLPLEKVLADPPAVIFTSGGKSGENRLLDHPALTSLHDTHRATLKGRLLWCGGPTIISAVNRLSEVRREILMQDAAR